MASEKLASTPPERRKIVSIGHPYLQAIEIDPGRIIIEDVEESLLARGDIKLSVADYTAIEEDLRSRMEPPVRRR